jgi:hypothetical protein
MRPGNGCTACSDGGTTSDAEKEEGNQRASIEM